ncbi:hypothetical protein ACOME3_001789 [Neoechinorhynchus agilis]
MELKDIYDLCDESFPDTKRWHRKRKGSTIRSGPFSLTIYNRTNLVTKIQRRETITSDSPVDDGLLTRAGTVQYSMNRRKRWTLQDLIINHQGTARNVLKVGMIDFYGTISNRIQKYSGIIESHGSFVPFTFKNVEHTRKLMVTGSIMPEWQIDAEIDILYVFLYPAPRAKEMCPSRLVENFGILIHSSSYRHIKQSINRLNRNERKRKIERLIRDELFDLCLNEDEDEYPTEQISGRIGSTTQSYSIEEYIVRKQVKKRKRNETKRLKVFSDTFRKTDTTVHDVHRPNSRLTKSIQISCTPILIDLHKMEIVRVSPTIIDDLRRYKPHRVWKTATSSQTVIVMPHFALIYLNADSYLLNGFTRYQSIDVERLIIAELESIDPKKPQVPVKYLSISPSALIFPREIDSHIHRSAMCNISSIIEPSNGECPICFSNNQLLSPTTFSCEHRCCSI